MARIIIDFDPALDEASELPGDTSDLVYFLSWAYSARYGASHELSLAANLLRHELGIDTKPLLTFADRNVEEPEDEGTLEQAWQDAAPLATCCAAVADALRESTDDRLTTDIAEYGRLRENIEALGRLAGRAAERGARIRVTYLLADAS